MTNSSIKKIFRYSIVAMAAEITEKEKKNLLKNSLIKRISKIDEPDFEANLLLRNHYEGQKTWQDYSLGPHFNLQWGTDRINQRDLPLDEKFSRVPLAGKGAPIFIFSSGFLHPIESQYYWRPQIRPLNYNRDEYDLHGAGTFMTILATSEYYGSLAINSDVYHLQGSRRNIQTTLDKIEALEWLLTNGPNQRGVFLSDYFFTFANLDLKQAFLSIIKSGYLVVAPGGDGQDENTRNACRVSPGNLEGALSVGLVNQNDSVTFLSARGPCVDIWAPGMNIKSITQGMPEEKSGNWIAATYVAAVAAQVMAIDQSGPKETIEKMLNMSTKNRVKGLTSDEHNRLLYLKNAVDPLPRISLGRDVFSSGSVKLTAEILEKEGNLTSFLWTQLEGPEVALPAPTPLFEIDLENLRPGKYVFSFTAKDEHGTTTKRKNVYVGMAPGPRAEINAPLMADINTAIQVDGSGSYNINANNSELENFFWHIVGDGEVTIEGATSKTPTLTFLTLGTYYLYLIVQNDEGKISTTSKKIEVVDIPNITVGDDRMALLGEIVTSEVTRINPNENNRITHYFWKQLKGPTEAKIESSLRTGVATLSGFAIGEYEFQGMLWIDLVI